MKALNPNQLVGYLVNTVAVSTTDSISNGEQPSVVGHLLAPSTTVESLSNSPSALEPAA